MKFKSTLMAAAAAILATSATVLANEIEIKTAEQLIDLSSEYFTHNSTVTLVADLDFEGTEGFSPLGSHGTPFHGTFNGNGHVISNLHVKTDQFKYIGLFGIVNGATIYNFTLDDTCSFTSDAKDIVTIGAVVAFSERGVHLSHVVNNADVHYNGTAKFVHVGGLIGMMHSYYDNPGSIIIFQCHNFGTILSSGGHTGGVVGSISLNGTNSLIDIEQTSNSGLIVYSGNHTLAGVGGVVGKITVLNETMKSYILHSSNYGQIKLAAAEQYTTVSVGGILGAADFSSHSTFSVKSCINEGNLYSQSSAVMGGIAGILYSHHEGVFITVRNSVNRGLVLLDYDCSDEDTNSYLGGVVGYAYTTLPDAAGKDGHVHILNCLNHGDIATRYSLAYVGGIAGRLFPYTLNSTLVVNCLSEGIIVPVAPAPKLYNYGGIAGFAMFSSGEVGPMILYSYYTALNGEAVPDVSETFLTEVSSYDPRTHEFHSRITVEGKEYHDTISALNALTSFDTEEEMFVKWLIFSFEENGGFYMPLKPEIMHLEYVAPPNPSRLGGAFRGWYLDAALTKPLNITALTPGPHILHAKWVMFSYSISFYDTDKKLLSKETGECGSPVTFPVVKVPGNKVLVWTYENGRAFTSKNFVNADVDVFATFVDKSAANAIVAPSAILFAIVALLVSFF